MMVTSSLQVLQSCPNDGSQTVLSFVTDFFFTSEPDRTVMHHEWSDGGSVGSASARGR